jgi:hypothetical protein
MRSAFIALLLLVAAPSVSAQAPRIERIDLVDYGIYESVFARRIEDSQSVGGSRSGVKMIKIKERTSTIQAHNGLLFGIRFFVVGEPKDAEVKLKFVLRFPMQGMHDATTGVTRYRNEFVRTAKVGWADFSGYSFDYDWELVPGVWTFEVWEGDRKWVEKALTVAKP